MKFSVVAKRNDMPQISHYALMTWQTKIVWHEANGRNNDSWKEEFLYPVYYTFPSKDDMISFLKGVDDVSKYVVLSVTPLQIQTTIEVKVPDMGTSNMN